MVKENYYQEHLDIWKAEKTAASGNSGRIAIANTALTYFEGQMDTWCKQGFTAKTLPDYESSKMILWNTANTHILLGDHTIYFDKIYTKDNCNVKVCSIVQDSNNAGSTQITNNFQVVLDS